MAAAGAGAEDAHLAVRVGLRAEKAGAGGGVADDLIVRDTPFGTDFRADIFGRALGDAAVEVGRDGCIAARGELACRFLVPGVPAGHVVNEDDGRERAGPEWAGEVGIDGVAIGSGDDGGFGEHSFVVVGSVGHGSGSGQGLMER